MVYHPTPVQELPLPVFTEAGVRVMIKREDLNHPAVSGNKWWKLKYNLQTALDQNFRTILTFGGAYSNHIYSTAAAAKEHGLRSVGIIRGEETIPLNPTLSFARSQGMELHFISRERYKEKSDKTFAAFLSKTFGSYYSIPEGGTNLLAVKACCEFAERELSGLSFDELYLPVGTGGTIAGLICGFEGKKKIRGIPVLKNGDFLRAEIQKLTFEFSGKDYGNWSLLTSYHHGGYAKVTKELLEFVNAMKRHNLPLDHVYTGKLLWGVIKEVEAGKIARGSTVLVLHTGGLQGTDSLTQGLEGRSTVT